MGLNLLQEATLTSGMGLRLRCHPHAFAELFSDPVVYTFTSSPSPGTTMNKLLALLFLLVAASAQSQTVYRTVDESGAVSFSDTPPNGDQEVEQLELQVAPPQDPEAYSQRLEDMRETTDRMAEDRRAREKHRAEMRELAARNNTQQASNGPTMVDHYSTGWSTGGYYYRPGRPPWRPGYRPKPEHPIYRPPVHIQPLPSHPLQGNSQLMRPILSR